MHVSRKELAFMALVAFNLGLAPVLLMESQTFELVQLVGERDGLHEYVQDYNLSRTDCEGMAEGKSLIGGVWECRLEVSK